MGKYDNATKKVGDKLSGSGIDPLTITMIITLILEAIKTIQKCRNPEDVIKSMKKRPKGNRALVTLVTRRVLGRKKFKVDGERVVNAILEAGLEATPEEIEELLKD